MGKNGAAVAGSFRASTRSKSVLMADSLVDIQVICVLSGGNSTVLDVRSVHFFVNLYLVTSIMFHFWSKVPPVQSMSIP